MLLLTMALVALKVRELMVTSASLAATSRSLLSTAIKEPSVSSIEASPDCEETLIFSEAFLLSVPVKSPKLSSPKSVITGKVMLMLTDALV